jgi:EpsI family protein
MITSRLALMQVILAGGLASVFVLPKEIRIQPAAIALSLPAEVGEWQGQDRDITQGERDILGPDTQFARKSYVRGQDEIYVSIVLSGPDMNTSIHRPERCLPAQGWTIVDSGTVAVPLPDGPLQAVRLHNLQNVRTSSGRSVPIQGLNYYWFVGHSETTPSSLRRTWIDIRDRVLHGRNQQWAYVTVAATVTRDFRIFGLDEKQTDSMIQDFLRELVPQLHR